MKEKLEDVTFIVLGQAGRQLESKISTLANEHFSKCYRMAVEYN